jgi:hypothetical protein
MIANPGSVETTLNYELIRSNGSVRGRATIYPQGSQSQSRLVADLFPGSMIETTDYVRVTATSGVSALELFGEEGKYIQALNAREEDDGASVLYSPQYIVGGSWSSRLSVINLDSRPGEVKFEFFGDSGVAIGAARTLPIPARGKILISDQSFFLPAGSDATQGYLRITGAGLRLTGAAVFGDGARFGDVAQKKFCTTLPLISTLERSLLFGNIASSSMLFTGISLVNSEEGPANATVQIFEKSGVLAAAKTLTIPPRGRLSQPLTRLFPEFEGKDVTSGYIKVILDRDAAGFAVFGAKDLSSVLAIPAQSLP